MEVRIQKSKCLLQRLLFAYAYSHASRLGLAVAVVGDARIRGRGFVSSFWQGRGSGHMGREICGGGALLRVASVGNIFCTLRRLRWLQSLV